MSKSSAVSTLRWIVLLPVLFVGSLLYWSVAVCLGGMSVMTMSALAIVPGPSDPDAPRASGGMDGMAVAGASTITIRLEESAEPEDVNDNIGAGDPQPLDQPAQPVDAVRATPSQGPGITSY